MRILPFIVLCVILVSCNVGNSKKNEIHFHKIQASVKHSKHVAARGLGLDIGQHIATTFSNNHKIFTLIYKILSLKKGFYIVKNSYTKNLNNTDQDTLCKRSKRAFELQHNYDSLLALVESTQLQTENKSPSFFIKILPYILLFPIIICLTVLVIFLKIKSIRFLTQKEYLQNENQILKSIATIHMASKDNEIVAPLNKDRINKVINGSLNKSDWKILTILSKNPSISNREISQEVLLSIEGVRSSLKKMYRIFTIRNADGNQRMALVIKAVQLSRKSYLPEKTLLS